jgi:hypothetical protein
MADEIDMSESSSVVLDGAGYGVARCGPGRAGAWWLVTSYALSVANYGTEQSAVRIYVGEPSPGSELDSSYDGNRNASSDIAQPLHSGQYLAAEWTDGTPGARATLSVFGKRRVA